MIPAGAVRDRSRLEQLLGGDDLAWLRRRVRARLERGGAVEGVASLQEPTAPERAAADRLLGRRPTSGASVTVDLAAVDRLLREAEVCDGLAAAVAALDGPVVDRRGVAQAEEARWGDVHARLAAGLSGEPWAKAFVAEVASTGLLRRLAGSPEDAQAIIGDVLAVVGSLPAGGVGLPRFAAAVLADSHSLDDERPVGTLVLKALQHGLGAGPGPLPTGEDRRALWAAAGVLRDELARPVLSLGLAVGGAGMTDRVLAAHVEAGEPVRLTLRQLVRHPPDLSPQRGVAVHVCENPAVVAAAADELGTLSRPLVCVEGQPASASQTLLRLLREAGAALTYHGDFDWGGVRIANLVVDRFGARPWRFDRASYDAAPDGPPLRGREAAAAWDPGLAAAMRHRGVAVHEEQVLDDLLDDLSQPD